MTDTKEPTRAYDIETGETTSVGPGWYTSEPCSMNNH